MVYAAVMDAWMQTAIDKLVEEHGTVPPPWVVYDEHPYSICWRMGGGEGHIMLWWPWWRAQDLDEAARIAYFRRWPVPPAWLPFLIDAVWDRDSGDDDASDDDAALLPYFAQTATLGFGDHAAYLADLDDPAWDDDDA
ncbi:MAG TPA: hypothetical protein VGF99_03370 [Myxococcota bacterium]